MAPLDGAIHTAWHATLSGGAEGMHFGMDTPVKPGQVGFKGKPEGSA
ncbi:MAG: hypothetical protein ACKVH7_15310 [Alphaproteobacteria bacterium]